ncbi:DMT family transporter [Thermosipho globiformans]|uniref:DMT family transporter n=1 Tax=Thermosipho globiformans TaxID=380685 RepID=UPI000F8CBE46|nr:EamA family transporter [Thermosipho globiformans]
MKVIISGIAMSVIFGLSFLFTKNALDFTTPYNFLSIRFLFASLSFLILFALKIIKIKNAKKLYKLLIVAFFQPILYFIFETNGLKFATSSEAGILIATIPIFITFLSPFILKEKIPKINYLFVFLSFSGVLLIMGLNINEGFKGKILILFAVFSAVFYNFASKYFSKEFSPQEVTFVMMITGWVFFTILALIKRELDYSVISNKNVFSSAIYLGIFSSTIAFFLINYMLSKVSPVQSSIFSNLTTVVSVMAGFFIRNERITLNHIIGMSLIILGVWGVNYFKYRSEK